MIGDHSMKAHKIGNTVTSFLGDMSEAEKQDIQDCLLYAEIQADKGRGSGPWAWLSNYQHALLKLGFDMESYIVDQPLLISNAHQVRDYKVQVAGVQNSQGLANLLGELFDSLYLERDALGYLTHPPAEALVSNRQCAPCEKTREGVISVFVCGLQLSCRPHEKNPELTFVRLNSKGGSFKFDATVYAALKDEVQTIVRDFASTMIQEFDV